MKIHSTGPLSAGLVEIGKVVKPQGIKGELKVALYSGDLKGFRRLFLAAGGPGEQPRAYELLTGREAAAMAIIRLAGVDDRDQAEKLRGFTIAVEVDLLPRLPEGEIYWYQLDGLPARAADGREIGTVSGLLPTAARPVLVITSPDGREILVPVHDEFISFQAADGSAAFLLLTPPPGLLEING